MQITAYLIGRVKIGSYENCHYYSLPLVSILIYLKNGEFATFIYNLSFQLKLQYFKCSEAVFSENSHALLANIQSKFLI